MNVHKRIVALIVFVSLAILLTSSADIHAADAKWDAKYWNNTVLDGDPVLHRTEDELDHDWGDGSPSSKVNDGNFSARWKRTINEPAGTYRFTATMDDGMRVWVDDVLIIDSWYDSQVHTVTADVYLDGSDTDIRVKYFEAEGDAVAKLHWTRISGSTGTSVINWRGEYFNNRDLSGGTAMVRDDGDINFDWGNGSPASGVVDNDNFSVRWTKNVNLTAGRYRFSVTADDGVRLWVNNSLIIDQWHDSASTTYSAEITLNGGSVPIKMEYYEHGGGARARLNWLLLDGSVPTTFSQWRAEYYSNRFLVGAPALVRNDSAIDFNWGYGVPAPGIPADDFSVRWTRNLDLSAGTYRFTMIADDGVRVWVNNQLIIDKWFDQAATHTADINLPGGSVPMKVEHYENQAQAQARLSWTKLGASTPVTGDPGRATVTAYALNVRQGPSTAYSRITSALRNTVVSLTHRNGDASWVRVVLPDGTAGWVSATYLASDFKPFTHLPLWEGDLPTSAPAAPAAPTTTSAVASVARAYHLNVRSGPGTGYGIVSVINFGQTVTLSGFRNASGSWVKITLSDGSQGWVNSYYLNTAYPITNLAVGGW